MATTDTFWLSCIQHFENELSTQQFNTWIKPLQLRLSITNDELILVAPNRFVLQWVKDNFLPRIEQIAKSHFSRTISFQLKLDEETAEPIETVIQKEAVVATPALKTTKPSSVVKKRSTEINKSRLNPFFTFKTFVNGKANQLARAGAIQVAERPGSAYNPLFIYGGVGLGKTHLMHAVGNEILKNEPGKRIVYVHSEKFVSDMVKALQLGAMNEFKSFYRNADALLIDDIQFFAGKEQSQEEFFHTFNALLDRNNQMILTCDKYPKEIDGLEERLKSRLGWGLPVVIDPPELETRAAVLMQKASSMGVEMPNDCAFYIAQRIRSNIRELEGALKRVIANARFTNQPIDLALVKDALKDLFVISAKMVSIENIQKTVAEYYNIKLSDLLSKRRSRSITRPRQLAMALTKELTNHSLPEIGEAFNGRDHTTVLHACKKIAELRKENPSQEEDYRNLNRALTN